MHPFAELERDYRQLQNAALKLEVLADNHSQIDYEPNYETVDLLASDEWVEEKAYDLINVAETLVEETSESLLDLRIYVHENDVDQEIDDIRRSWQEHYHEFSTAVEDISEEFESLEQQEPVLPETYFEDTEVTADE